MPMIDDTAQALDDATAGICDRLYDDIWVAVYDRLRKETNINSNIASDIARMEASKVVRRLKAAIRINI